MINQKAKNQNVVVRWLFAKSDVRHKWTQHTYPQIQLPAVDDNIGQGPFYCCIITMTTETEIIPTKIY